MAGSWQGVLQDWYRYRGRREAAGPVVDIELDVPGRNSGRVHFGCSTSELTLISEDRTIEPNFEPRLEEPIYLELDFGDGIYTKPLEYGTFSRWTALEGLMIDLEKDGMVIQELWDGIEKMRVCGGDWDARVRPGWYLDVAFRSETRLQKDWIEDDSDSEDSEDDEDRWVDEVLDEYQKEWCLPRWRNKVEQETPARRYAKEPSRVVVGVACISIVFFVVAVVVYTA